jgi:hypothetical protein
MAKDEPRLVRKIVDVCIKNAGHSAFWLGKSASFAKRDDVLPGDACTIC